MSNAWGLPGGGEGGMGTLGFDSYTIIRPMEIDYLVSISHLSKFGATFIFHH